MSRYIGDLDTRFSGQTILVSAFVWASGPSKARHPGRLSSACDVDYISFCLVINVVACNTALMRSYHSLSLLARRGLMHIATPR